MQYRVWDKTNKTYKSPDAPFYLCEDGAILDKHFDIRNKDVKIEFSTGLKDKNGKLIYEGDILKDNYHNHVIKFDNGSFVMNYYNNEGEERNLLLYPQVLEVNEIIGNIYENHELLKGLKNDWLYIKF